MPITTNQKNWKRKSTSSNERSPSVNRAERPGPPLRWSSILTGLLSGFVLLAFAGCQSVPKPAVPAAPLQQVSWPQRLQSRSLYWQRAQILYKVQLQTPRGKTSLRAIITAQLPASLRIEASSIWGRTQGVYTQDPTTARLWIPAQNSVYVSNDSELMMRRLIGIPIPADTLLQLLLACAPPTAGISVQVANAGQQDAQPATIEAATVAPHMVWRLAIVDGQLTGIDIQSRSNHYTVRYHPGLDPAGQRVPKRVALTYQDWQLQVETLQVVRPEQIDPTVFQMTPPAAAETHFIP